MEPQPFTDWPVEQARAVFKEVINRLGSATVKEQLATRETLRREGLEGIVFQDEPTQTHVVLGAEGVTFSTGGWLGCGLSWQEAEEVLAGYRQGETTE